MSPERTNEGDFRTMKQPILEYYDFGEKVTAFSTTRFVGDGTSRSTSAACPSSNYAEFNINPFCGDDVAHISRNRQALCSLLGIGDSQLLMPHQVHLTKTVRIDEALLSLPEEQRREALDGYDALMTDLKDVCIGVSTADCIPILLHDEFHHAVCAVHAGWRGTVARIVEKALAEMRTAFDTRPEQVKAQIGPGINLDSFEVGDEVYEAFVSEGFPMELISKRYPSPQTSPSAEKWHIDLPECNRQQLLAAGVPAASIAVSPVCTYEQSDRFFSARRLGINSGRIFTGIMMV